MNKHRIHTRTALVGAFLVCCGFQSAGFGNPIPQKSRDSFAMTAKMFAQSDMKGYYLDKGKWLAVNPDKVKTGSVGRTFSLPTGVYNVTLRAVGENDGQSSYELKADETLIGTYKCPLSKQMFEEGSTFHKTWKNVRLTEGAVINVSSTVGSADGMEYSRARWAAVVFRPADAATRAAAGPVIAAAKSQKPTGSVRSKPATSLKPLQQPRRANGDGSVVVSGETKVWHKVTLNLAGPYAHEKDNKPNPFTDYRMSVAFTHADGDSLTVLGYFAADGNASETSAEDGTTWRAHFAPNKSGRWEYKISFHQGQHAALDISLSDKAKPIGAYNGKTGSLTIADSDKKGKDFRAHGLLQYVGQRYLQFAGSGRYFLKVGADAPETLLAFADFDNTIAGNKNKAPLKTWGPHVQDWKTGDPIWKDGKGKGLIGAINYLSGKGCNAFSFLTYNAGGDGDNVWPFIQREDKLHYDCSKLDQWGIVFDHGTAQGMYLHFKMQETENDDNKSKGKKTIPESLDGGDLGVQRRLYCRELIARFGHNLALNWNLGEENTQTTAQQKAMIDYIAAIDPYDHNIVVHTYPNEQDKVYVPLLGDKSRLTGASLQNSSLKTTHTQTLKWVNASTKAGKPWVIAFDESGSAKHAQSPDLGYQGFDGHDRQGKMAHTQHEVRKQTLWGTLMAGGAGCEYYFGYQFVENDILCQDWRSRDQSWDYCRIAINFFHAHKIPFHEMQNADELVGNTDHGISKFCFAKKNNVYLVYLPDGGQSELDLKQATGQFSVRWFNPRTGGKLQAGSIAKVSGGKSVSLGTAPADADEDWLIVVTKQS